MAPETSRCGIAGPSDARANIRSGYGLSRVPPVRARELRVERRLTLDEIVERLVIPRTTIYEWIKDLPKPRSTAGQAKRVAAMQAKYQRLRDEAYAQGAAEFATLAAQPTFRDFIVLYIAEGSKRERNCVAICNSDGAVMGVAHRWLQRLSAKRLDYAVQYHADQDLDELRSHIGVRRWGSTAP
jgi:predicted DNA-binding transcriptional regulator AlpA